MTTLGTPQPLQALALANRVRSERAQLKRRLNRGALLLADVLRDPPACLDNMRVEELLVAVRWIGRTKAARAMRLAGIPPTRKVGNLTYREAERLIAVARDCFPTLRLEREVSR